MLFRFRSRFPTSVDELFAWHASPGAFERLAPPWERLEVVERSGGICDGGRLAFRIRMGPLRVTWVADHPYCVPGACFTDVQARGPFRTWIHEHRMAPAAAGSVLEDRIQCELPAGAIGRRLGADRLRRELERMFAFRHRRTLDDLTRRQEVARFRHRRVEVRAASAWLAGQLGGFLAGVGHVLVERADEEDDVVVDVGKLGLDDETGPEPPPAVGRHVIRVRRREWDGEPAAAAVCVLVPPVLAHRNPGFWGLLWHGDPGRPHRWIAWDDLVGLVGHLVATGDRPGRIEPAAPVPLTRREADVRLRGVRRPRATRRPPSPKPGPVPPGSALVAGYRLRWPDPADALAAELGLVGQAVLTPPRDGSSTRRSDPSSPRVPGGD